MRMAFGLVGILGTLIAIVFALSYLLPRSQPAINAGRHAQGQAQQIAGRDANNAPATDSITLASEDSNGRMTGVLVTSVVPGGAMEKHFGLKRNDTIVEIGMGGGVLQPVNQMSTAGEARDALLTAYEQSQPIAVIRNEKAHYASSAGDVKQFGKHGSIHQRPVGQELAATATRFNSEDSDALTGKTRRRSQVAATQ